MRKLGLGVTFVVLTASRAAGAQQTDSVKEPVKEPIPAATAAAKPCASGEPCATCGTQCDTYPWEGATEFGLRVSLANVSGPKDVTTLGVQFAGASTQHVHRGVFTLRGATLFGLGGGTGGLEGALGGSLTGGIRAPVAENHGPFARVGIGGELMGNSQFYFSHIDLPLGEVGYQFARDRYVFEIGGRVSPTLTGRYNTGDIERRELGSSFAWAGYLSSLGRHGRFDASFTRFETRQGIPGTPVSVGRATACGYFAKMMAVCVDGMYIVGDEQPTPALLPPLGASTTARSFYGGLTIGLLSGVDPKVEKTAVTPAPRGSD